MALILTTQNRYIPIVHVIDQIQIMITKDAIFIFIHHVKFQLCYWLSSMCLNTCIIEWIGHFRKLIRKIDFIYVLHYRKLKSRPAKLILHEIKLIFRCVLFIKAFLRFSFQLQAEKLNWLELIGSSRCTCIAEMHFLPKCLVAITFCI